MTTARRRLLERGKEMEHAGGFYTADLADHRRCEFLRSEGFLRFWSGRRIMFWRAQFYTITEAGRAALDTSNHREDK